MHGAILPGLGLGVALKIDDGAKRASEVAMAAILEFLGVLAPMETGAAATAMAAFLEAPVTNARGETVGTIRMAEGWEPSTALKSEAGDR
ncbi:MAG: asparaginase [Proteobacteria bacterium]|nr:asparaginase [Pseudomonadota bacterium]